MTRDNVNNIATCTGYFHCFDYFWGSVTVKNIIPREKMDSDNISDEFCDAQETDWPRKRKFNKQEWKKSISKQKKNMTRKLVKNQK